eukprot:scaffold804_cov165-Amphora_coffeaeformis.AAC.8
MATISPPFSMRRRRSNQSSPSRRNPFLKERMFPKSLDRTSSTGKPPRARSPRPLLSFRGTSPATSLEEVDTMSGDDLGEEMFFRNSSIGTCDNSTATKRASNQQSKRGPSRLGECMLRQRSGKNTKSNQSDADDGSHNATKPNLAANMSVDFGANFTPPERVFSPMMNTAELGKVNSFGKKQQKRSLTKPGLFRKNTLSSSVGSTSTDGTGTEHDSDHHNVTDDELKTLDETHVLFDEDNTVFEISLAHQNYRREEIWNETVDNETTKVQPRKIEPLKSPPRIRRTPDVNGAFSPLAPNSEFTTTEPTITFVRTIDTNTEPAKDESNEPPSEPPGSQNADEGNTKKASDMEQNERDESVQSSRINASGSGDPLPIACTQTEQSSVHLTWKVDMAVEPSLKRAQSQDQETESRGSRSASAEGNGGNENQTSHDDSSDTTKPIMWIRLTPSAFLPEIPPPQGGDESRSASHLQYSEDASLAGKSRQSPEIASVQSGRSVSSSSSTSRISRGGSVKSLGSQEADKRSVRDNTNERLCDSTCSQVSKKNDRISTKSSKGDLPPLPSAKPRRNNGSTSGTAASTSGKKSSESTSSRSVSWNSKTSLPYSGERSEASSIMEYPSSVELESAADPTKSGRRRGTSGPVDLDLSFSESFASEPEFASGHVDLDISFSELQHEVSCVASKTDRDGSIQGSIASGAMKQASSTVELLSKASSKHICASTKSARSSSRGEQKKINSSQPPSVASKTGRNDSIQSIIASSVVEEASDGYQRPDASSKRSTASLKSTISENTSQKFSGEDRIEDSETLGSSQYLRGSVDGRVVTSTAQASNGSSPGDSEGPKSVIDSGTGAGNISGKEVQSKGTSPSIRSRSSNKRSSSPIATLSKRTLNSGISASVPTATVQPIPTVVSELSWDSMPEENWGPAHDVPDEQSAEVGHAENSTETTPQAPTEDQKKLTPFLNEGSEVSALCDELQSEASEETTKFKDVSRSTGQVSVTLWGDSNAFTDELARSIKNELEKLHVNTSDIMIEIAPAVSKQSLSIDSALVTAYYHGRVQVFEKSRSAAVGLEEVRFHMHSPLTVFPGVDKGSRRYEHVQAEVGHCLSCLKLIFNLSVLSVDRDFACYYPTSERCVHYPERQI